MTNLARQLLELTYCDWLSISSRPIVVLKTKQTQSDMEQLGFGLLGDQFYRCIYLLSVLGYRSVLWPY